MGIEGEFIRNVNGNYFYKSSKLPPLVFSNDVSLCFSTLYLFRNKYVHAGSSMVFEFFEDLYSNNKDELNFLADFVGVKLNWDVVLYKAAEKKPL